MGILKDKIFLSENLQQQGIELGNIINSEPNILEVYLIFNKNFEGNVLVKIKGETNIEIGRSSISINQKEGEAGYFKFTFDALTNADGKSNNIYVE